MADKCPHCGDKVEEDNKVQIGPVVMHQVCPPLHLLLPQFIKEGKKR